MTFSSTSSRELIFQLLNQKNVCLLKRICKTCKILVLPFLNQTMHVYFSGNIAYRIVALYSSAYYGKYYDMACYYYRSHPRSLSNWTLLLVTWSHSLLISYTSFLLVPCHRHLLLLPVPTIIAVHSRVLWLYSQISKCAWYSLPLSVPNLNNFLKGVSLNISIQYNEILLGLT